MKIKNKSFNILLLIIVFTITSFIILNIEIRQFRTPIVAEIDPEKPMVALTFDDGPNALYTPQVLDILYDNNALATFFVLGKNIAANHQLIKEMVISGHLLGNHTFSHYDISTLSIEAAIYELYKTQVEINKVLPDYKFKYYRPPYGRGNERLSEVCRAIRVPLDIDSEDWFPNSSENICNNVLNNVKDGDIIIFHDNNPALINALPIIIKELKNRGFQFVTVDRLLQ